MPRSEKKFFHQKPTALFLSLIMMASALTYSSQAKAEVSDRQAFFWMGFYGVLAGTAMGLIATPLTQNPKSIFIGTSIGLYLGTVGSIYHFTHRDDPGNPLSPNNPDYSQASQAPTLGFSSSYSTQSYSPVIALSIPVATF